VTDHRAGVTLHRLEQMMEGELDELIAAIQAHMAELAEKRSVGPTREAGEAA
jgi:peptide chain release factor 1